jgi:tetratricopeptide (TPR) repeat protein
MGGTDVALYHAVNLLIHILACLTVFGIVRRTLNGPAIRGRFNPYSDAISLMVALIWGLHPLQTESVTYISQRAEELMGLFFLQTLYCFIRSVGPGGRVRTAWGALAFLCCLLGMATKEVMVTAPALILLYDVVFVGGSLRQTWRRRWPLHIALMSTWALLACLMRGISQLGVGYDQGESWRSTALTECRAVAEYFALSVWPRPLVLFRDPAFIHDAGTVVLPGILLLTLLGLTLVFLIRRPAVGFAGAWAFAILAPTSTIVPILRQPVAEHRMYLPLAGLIVLFVAGAFALAGRRSLVLGAVVALVFGCVTWDRNRDYRSELAIWTDTVKKEPGNSSALNDLGQAYLNLGRYQDAIEPCTAAIRANPDNEAAHNNLGFALVCLGRSSEAVKEFNEALRIRPDFPAAENNLGAVLFKSGHGVEAIPHYREALRLHPDYVEARNNLGGALAACGRLPEAIAEYETVLRQEPDYPGARAKLGIALFNGDRIPEAVEQFERALKAKPDDTEILYNLGVALAKEGELAGAIDAYRDAIRIAPNYAEAHNNLGGCLLRAGRAEEAAAEYRSAIRSKPDYPEAHDNLGQTLKQLGKTAEAVEEYRTATRLAPEKAPFHFNLAIALVTLSSWPEALAEFRQAVRLDQGHAEAHNGLGALYCMAGRFPEAIAELSEAVRLKPDYAEAHKNLGVALESANRKSEAAVQFEIASRLSAKGD